MPRPVNPDLIRPWKNNIPAAVAGAVEFRLLDPVLQKPRYGARSILLTRLLEWWLAREAGSELPEVPTATQLLQMDV